MKQKIKNHLWFYPILFGILGVFLGLFVRYFFAYSSFSFPIKNVIHSHSHIMLLGLLFNALVILVWERFTDGIDKTSYKLFITLQICLGGMLMAFVIQGYAIFSILFSTLHLWISYLFVVRLWKRLKGNQTFLRLIKIGVVFHFVSSLGPYFLGPLMVLEMQYSPWYQQAVFFYLHFQFFGVLFLWLLAVFFNSTNINLKEHFPLTLSIVIIGLFAHSLDYSFNHWSINAIGGICSITLFYLFITLFKYFSSQNLTYKLIFGLLIAVALFNILGSVPFFAEIVINDHLKLIAWLHFLFLGVYLPFIWIESPLKVSRLQWSFYFVFVMISELLLLFPEYVFLLFNISIMKLLFFAYLAITLSICFIHFRYFINNGRHL